MAQLKDLIDDSLGLAKNRVAQAMLAKEGDNSPKPEVVYFSDLLVKINKRNREQLRALLITDKAIYNLTTDFSKMKRRIPLEEVFSISVSKISHEFVVHVPSEYDYRFKSSKKVSIAELINELIKRRTHGREAKTLFRENNVLRNYQGRKRKGRGLARRFSLFAEKGDDLLKAANAAKQKSDDAAAAASAAPAASSADDKNGAVSAPGPAASPDITPHPSPLPETQHSSSRHPKIDVKRFEPRCSNLVKPSHGVDDIWSVFQKIRLLGEGSYAKVYLVSYLNHPDRGRFALKQMRKTDEFEQNMFEREVSILSHLRHAGICRFYDCFECPNNFFMLQRACLGGELFDKVASQGGIKEPQAAMIMAEVLQIIAHLHEQGVAHRDIKLENLMYTSRDQAARLQLIDFGFARRVDLDKQYDEIVGALMYLSPELVESARNVANPIKGTVLMPSDMWAFGSLTYVVITGTHAFASDGEADESFDKILECAPPYDKVEMTEVAEDFVRKLLVLDPKQRLTAKQALDHPWIKPHLKPIAIKQAKKRAERNGKGWSLDDDVEACRVASNKESGSGGNRRSSRSAHGRSPSFSSGSLSSRRGDTNGVLKPSRQDKEYANNCKRLLRMLRQMNGHEETDESEFKSGIRGPGVGSVLSMDDFEEVGNSDAASPRGSSGGGGARRFDLTKLVDAIEDEWSSVKRELADLREKLEDQMEHAEELQEQQLSMIQSRQRAQLELAEQLKQMQNASPEEIAAEFAALSGGGTGGPSPPDHRNGGGGGDHGSNHGSNHGSAPGSGRYPAAGDRRGRTISAATSGEAPDDDGSSGKKKKKKKKHSRTSTLGRFTLGRKSKNKRKDIPDFDFSDGGGK